MPLCHTLRSITLFHFISSKIWYSESCGAQVFITAAPLGGRPSAEGLMELCAALRMFPRCRGGWVVNRKFWSIWYSKMISRHYTVIFPNVPKSWMDRQQRDMKDQTLAEVGMVDSNLQRFMKMLRCCAKRLFHLHRPWALEM